MRTVLAIFPGVKTTVGLCATALLLAGAGVACGSDDEGSGDPQAVEVIVDDYAFSRAPDELEAGVVEVTLENQGEVGHEAQLVSIGDTSVEQFVEDFGPVLEGGPFPDYAEEVTGLGGVDPGQTVTSTFTITEGNYVWFCTFTDEAGGEEGAEGDPHFMRGMVKPLTVSGGDEEPALPDGDSSITARDYGFDVDVQAGDQTVNFTNEGPDQVHHAVLFAFTEGTSEDDAATALEAFLASEDEEAPPPPELDLEGSDSLGDSAVFSEGQGGTFELELESGRTYGVLCFLSDRDGGPPHAVAHDMYEIFTVD